MNRSNLYLNDILEAINKIERYTEGVDYDSFSSNEMLLDAVIRNLEVIGEAAKGVEEHIKEHFSEIPWRKMIALRNILIHQYFGIDKSIVWEVIRTNLAEVKPELLRAIQEVGETP
ncbi:MAG TPA: DUF86 domain-containing protein [Paenibacillus sp.]|uniref:HepT-like ribonuclease domain-containing protein n=1 Tax=Paenibacillus sp. TaxID=58172 RepID=UPI0028D90440|nr:DUF86 domain-containing protein [Paenibacillus sp.]HUC90398.1 DUF86 domain-containing protein [Paenibacillus sp.]